MKDIQNRLLIVQNRLQKAAKEYHRPLSSIQLLAVSKTRTAIEIKQAVDLGLSAFGENYLQEALKKMDQLKNEVIDWHFIGQIQSNKTRQIAQNFSWVHGLYQLKHAQRLNDQRSDTQKPLNVCIQVNIDHEATKAGLVIDEVQDFAAQIQTMKNLNLRGLMVIPKAKTDFEDQRQSFKKAKDCLKQLNLDLDTLSMGMSNDLEAAISEGATIVRIGTAIFGARKP